MRKRRISVFLLLALVAWAAPARAADPAVLRARELFDGAEAEYALTHYDRALAGYEEAFRTKQLPGLLFNIGQCHRQLRHYDKAALFYREYLERQPAAKNRALVESLIREVDEQATREKAAAQLAPPAQPIVPANAQGATANSSIGSAATAGP